MKMLWEENRIICETDLFSIEPLFQERQNLNGNLGEQLIRIMKQLFTYIFGGILVGVCKREDLKMLLEKNILRIK